MAGISILQFSDAVKVFHSQPPNLRTKMRVAGRAIPLAHVDVYCMRPIELQDLTFTEYFTRYELRDDAMQGFQDASRRVMGPGGEGVKDGRGKRLYWRCPNTPVRFSTYNPATQTEGFAYNLLLKTIPFHNESELLSAANSSNSYYE
ncbi:ATP-dependent DNA helicase PIF1, partial [Haematococcus lacustris]